MQPMRFHTCLKLVSSRTFPKHLLFLASFSYVLNTCTIWRCKMIAFLQNRLNSASQIKHSFTPLWRNYLGIRWNFEQKKKSPQNKYSLAFVSKPLYWSTVWITLCVNFPCQKKFFRATKLCNGLLTESEQNAFPSAPIWWAWKKAHAACSLRDRNSKLSVDLKIYFLEKSVEIRDAFVTFDL